MPELEPLYQTDSVAAATGATPRQLQWWDEQKILPVPVIDHKRLYRFRDAFTARVILRLGAKHITLRQSGEILTALSNGGGDLMRAAYSSDHILLIGTKTLDVRLTSRGLCYDVLLETEEPMVALDLREEAGGLEKALR